MTTAISNTNNAASAAVTKAGGNSVAETQDRFLTLLIAQMKAQDPMNPMDNSQMTSQMAQLSTVSGIEKLNASVASMSVAMLANQVGQGAGLLDKNVIAEGSKFSIKDGKGLAGFEIGESAEKVSVDILNPKGVSVKNIELSNVQPGATSFNMADYDIPDGEYFIRVNATNGGAFVENVTTLVQTRVKNLIPSADSGFQLGMENGAVIDMAKVRLVQSL